MTPPAVKGIVSRDGLTVLIRCPYCGRAHLHGAAGITDGRNNHRLVHCLRPTLAAEAGYVIHLPEGERHGR